MEKTIASIGTLTLGDSLPFDLVAEILCRLPVKSLLGFRCVCKSWNSLISNDPKFVKKHLHMMSTTKRHHLLTTAWVIAKELSVTSYPFDSLQLDSIFTSNPMQLDYSPIITSWKDGLIASCDGLLCFVIDPRLAVIYNPSIRKVKKLPSLDLPRKDGSTLFAFGYDPFIDNYKVVSVFSYGGHPYKDSCKSQVKVYTLGSDSWRRIEDFPSRFCCDRHGVFVSGTVNWLLYRNSGSVYDSCAIVSLHLGKESYQEIQHPDFGSYIMSTLDVMRDCLCLFSRKKTDTFTNVWLMKEYGNKESWIKLICLPYFSEPYYIRYTRIVYISEDNNQVLLRFREDHRLKWVVYDCKTYTFKSLKIQDLNSVDPRVFRIDDLGWVESKVYVESLISP